MQNGARGVVAGEELSVGCFVRVERGKAYSDPTLTGKGGIVRLPRGTPRREIVSEGEPVDVLRDGGALARVLADAELTIRGTTVRFVAGESHYLYITGGRVTGFLGDRRLA